MAISKSPNLNHPPIPLVLDEQPEHAEAIEALVDLDFGPERFAKTSYRLRDEREPVPGLGLVVLQGDTLVGTIRFWAVNIAGHTPALLLGPLAIHPDHQGQGIGRVLMHEGLARARAQGWKAVILVGDAPYYTRFGFRPELTENLTLPGPVDPARFLGLNLEPGTLEGLSGLVERIELTP